MPGRPFEPGNKIGKGRPPGSRNRKTIFQEALESHGKEIIDNVKLQALKSDPTAMRLCMERLLPVCKAPNSRFQIPIVRTIADLSNALPKVMQEVARGRLSAEDGEAVARIMESYRRVVEAEEFDKRLREVEQRGSETEE